MLSGVVAQLVRASACHAEGCGFETRRSRQVESAFVYILLSQKNNSYYIGGSNCPERRLLEHNGGKSKYTKNNRPYVIAFYQEYDSLKTARQIEYKLKKLASRKIIEKIITEGKIYLSVGPTAVGLRSQHRS